MTQSRWPNGLFNRLLRRQPPADLIPKGRNTPLRVGARDPLVDERRNRPYISNAIRTTRYTFRDFIPRQLAYQLTRLAHAYLMTVAILQLIPGLSTTGKFTQIIPLLIFIFLVMGKEAYYDWKRYRVDTPWEDIGVGDVVKLSRNEDVPADLVLLYASGENGLAYVDTTALDGETNLKPKVSPANLYHCSTIQGIAECHADFVIEQPNADLYRFDSTVTAKIIGTVVDTGEEGKIRMNSKQTMKPKRPALETMTNNIVICLALYVLVISSALTGGYFSRQSSTASKAWYLSGGSVPF
ncbi:putative phospholipid-transporting ATPase 5 [Colletotrichum shisoi]|uniref:Putative phospholipid-transporting ATPase 5 n=1 Tax=Colletotrichum shisoi TaxID=2078593 RepID=A0A5Q4C337_9PEZI|nr:putative phospholipid-transporting ATPase 5 [Colletotrichum shisoi]